MRGTAAGSGSSPARAPSCPACCTTVGGGVEGYAADLEAALRREVMEELGATIAVVRHDGDLGCGPLSSVQAPGPPETRRPAGLRCALSPCAWRTVRRSGPACRRPGPSSRRWRGSRW
ncbi:NUDIX domain-containing protein [Streptomyces sp. 900105755]